MTSTSKDQRKISKTKMVTHRGHNNCLTLTRPWVVDHILYNDLYGVRSSNSRYRSIHSFRTTAMPPSRHILPYISTHMHRVTDKRTLSRLYNEFSEFYGRKKKATHLKSGHDI